jgi:hypothetical protein
MRPGRVNAGYKMRLGEWSGKMNAVEKPCLLLPGQYMLGKHN